MEASKNIGKLRKKHSELLMNLSALGVIIEDTTPYGTEEQHLKQEIRRLQAILKSKKEQSLKNQDSSKISD